MQAYGHDSYSRLDRLSYLALLMRNLGPAPSNNIDSILQHSFDDIEDIKKPTSKNFIDNLPIHIITEEEEKNEIMCSICQDSLKKGTKSYKLPCPDNAHYFCIGDNPDECSGILPWLKDNNTCPICRHELPLEEVVEKITPINDTDTSDTDTSDTDTSDNRLPPPRYTTTMQFEYIDPVYDEDEDYEEEDDSALEGDTDSLDMLASVSERRNRNNVIGHRIRRRNVEFDTYLNVIYTPPLTHPADTTIGALEAILGPSAHEPEPAPPLEPLPVTDNNGRMSYEEVENLIPDIISRLRTDSYVNSLNTYLNARMRIQLLSNAINPTIYNNRYNESYLNENSEVDDEGFTESDMDQAIRLSLRES